MTSNMWFSRMVMVRFDFNKVYCIIIYYVTILLGKLRNAIFLCMYIVFFFQFYFFYPRPVNIKDKEKNYSIWWNRSEVMHLGTYKLRIFTECLYIVRYIMLRTHCPYLCDLF